MKPVNPSSKPNLIGVAGRAAVGGLDAAVARVVVVAPLPQATRAADAATAMTKTSTKIRILLFMYSPHSSSGWTFPTCIDAVLLPLT